MKYSNRSLIKHIKEQESQIESLNYKLTEASNEKMKYWGMYQEQLRKVMELSFEGNKEACECYLYCELANPICLTANGLNADCKQRAIIKDEIKRRIKEL